jgi:MFS family permease
MALAIAVCLAIHAVHQTGRFARQARFLYDNSYPESACVERTLATARGEPLYARTDAWPYNAAVYGPLFYKLPGLAMRALGPAADRNAEVVRAYFVGRAFSLVSALLILGAVWMLCGSLGLALSWRAAAILLFFSAPAIIGFGYSFRPDFPATALCLWAWAAALRLENRKGAALASSLMVLAILVKQTSAISALALFLALLAAGRKRDSLVYAAAGAALGGAAAGYLLLTAGPLWLENTVFSLASPFHLPSLYQRFLSLGATEAVPFAGAFAACLGLEFSAKKPEARRIFRIAFATLFFGFLLASMRVGGNLNYLLESYCWATVLTAACASRLFQRAGNLAGANGRGRSIAAAIVLGALIVPYLLRARADMADLPNQFKAPPPAAMRYAGIAEFLGQPHGEILTTQGYLWWMTPDPPTMMDAFLYSAQVAAGRLSPDDLAGKIARCEFGLIATHWEVGKDTPRIQGAPALPPQVEQAILQRYVLWCTVDGLRFYILPR